MTNKKYNPFEEMYNFNTGSNNWVQRLGHNADFYNNPLGYNSSPTPRPYDNTTVSGADDDNEVISGFTPQTPRTTSLNNEFNVNKQQPSMGNMSSFNLKGNNNASDFNANSSNWVQRLGHNADFYNNPLGYNSSPTPRPYDNTTVSDNSSKIHSKQPQLVSIQNNTNGTRKNTILDKWLNRNRITVNGTYLNSPERINALKNGKDIVINLENSSNNKVDLPWNHLPALGNYYVNKYAPLIDKYSEKYRINPDIVKAILYTEASDYHKNGMDFIADLIGLSDSVRPMNIQGKTWGNFQGQYYDVNDPEQNIELGVRILKSIYDAVPDKDVAKIGTLWNGTGLRQVNDYGLRAKSYYNNKPWNR